MKIMKVITISAVITGSSADKVSKGAARSPMFDLLFWFFGFPVYIVQGEVHVG